MRSFALAALTFLTLGVSSFAAPTPIPNDSSLLDVEAEAKVGVNVRRGDYDDSLVSIDADVGVDVNVRRGDYDDSLLDIDADVAVDVNIRRGDHDDSKHDDSKKDDSPSLEKILHKLIVDVEVIIDKIGKLLSFLCL